MTAALNPTCISPLVRRISFIVLILPKLSSSPIVNIKKTIPNSPTSSRVFESLIPRRSKA